MTDSEGDTVVRADVELATEGRKLKTGIYEKVPLKLCPRLSESIAGRRPTHMMGCASTGPSPGEGYVISSRTETLGQGCRRTHVDRRPQRSFPCNLCPASSKSIAIYRAYSFFSFFFVQNEARARVMKLQEGPRAHLTFVSHSLDSNTAFTTGCYLYLPNNTV
ncbi:hypothetical protein EI94DRAFT_1258232 [Lactarius quietus]|nr:hypothetical protein EI94DRAFT_1258232 [Lactarius quietus]